MIIGKPLTIGGATGGLKPTIVVTAPTGSTVTCDGVTGTEVSGTWTFVVTIGTHTIVATSQDQSKTKTETVVVDDVGIYPVSISYVTYLYNLGDECEEVTGGWSFVYNPASATLTKEASDIKIYASSSSYGTTVCTGNKIDLSNYTYACIEWMASKMTYTNCAFFAGASRDKNGDVQNFTIHPTADVPTSKITERIAINTSAKTEAYVKFGVYNGTLYVYKIWLE